MGRCKDRVGVASKCNNVNLWPDTQSVQTSCCHGAQCPIQDLHLCPDGRHGLSQHSPVQVQFTCCLQVFSTNLCRAAFLVKSENLAGELKDFNHPIFQVRFHRDTEYYINPCFIWFMSVTCWLQVWVMMLGESLCLIVHLLSTKEKVSEVNRPPLLLLLPPALCDLLVSTLTLLGLYLTTASQYQMLRGSGPVSTKENIYKYI